MMAPNFTFDRGTSVEYKVNDVPLCNCLLPIIISGLNPVTGPDFKSSALV